MSQRGLVVINIEDTPPPPESRSRHVPQRIPDTLFFTPSESDSDNEPEIIWDTRKQRLDKDASNIKSSTAQPTPRPDVRPHPPPQKIPAQQQYRHGPQQGQQARGQQDQRAHQQPPPQQQRLGQQQQQERHARQQPHQIQQHSRVSIANPRTQAFLAALSKSGPSTLSSTAPTHASALAPAPLRSNNPLPLSRSQLSRPESAAPDRSPRPHAFAPNTTKALTPKNGAMSLAVSQPTQLAQSTQSIRKQAVAPRWTSPNQPLRNAPPSSSAPSRASLMHVPDQSRAYPHEVLPKSRKVASPIAPSAPSFHNFVINAKPSLSVAASSSVQSLSKSQKISPLRQQPVELREGPRMPLSLVDQVASPTGKHISPQKPSLQSSVIEIDSSSEDEIAGPTSLDPSIHSLNQGSPRVSKRKLVELDDEEPVKRIRSIRSSMIQPELSTPSIKSVVSQDEVIKSVEVDRSQTITFPTDLSRIRPFANRFGQPFTHEEDALIIHLKEVVCIPWKDFERFFPGRKWPSMQTRFSKVLSKRTTRPVATKPLSQSAIATQPPYVNRELRRTTYAQANPPVDSSMSSQEEEAETVDDPNRCRRSVRPLNNLVRHREFGSTLGREWPRKFQAGIRDLAYGSMGAQAYMDNASGDVSTIAWSPDGEFFAAGAVAVTDVQSVDYNKPRNLVLGSAATQKIKELSHHTIKCRLPDGRRKELFSTVQAVAFSPDGRYMYSAGIDKYLHKYRVDESPHDTTLVHNRKHSASVDFISISNSGLVATGNASSGPGSIQVYPHHGDELLEPICFSGMLQAKRHPSALRWGVAHQHQDYLLAGFSTEAEVVYAEDDHRDKEGEVALWDIRTQQRLETDAPNRNVFDLAWNPNPGGNSSIFAVASRPISHVSHGIHSIVRLYAPHQTRASHTMELDCPAWDVNDVVYSPHDNNLIAVGSTEGCVHIWDVRYAKRGQQPLRTLKHGESLAIMNHEKKRWEVDTGIRFLSWGSERDRLYTGSSDGVVACWDPYRSDSDKHVRDVVQLNSAVMSGAFSPDFSRLLIGEDAARLNLLSVGNDGAKFNRTTTARFSVEEAPLQEEEVSASILWDCQKMLDAQELEVQPAGTMPFRQIVQGPNYSGPWRLPAEAVAMASNETLKETAKAREESQKFQDKVLMSLRRRKKQTRKLGLKPTNPCDLDCGFIPLPDDYEPQEVWLSKNIPDPSSGWLTEHANIACFRCGNKARINPKTRLIGCKDCGVAWRPGALGYEVVKQFKKEGASGSKVEEGDTDNVVDLCDSEDERARFIREVSASSTDSDLE